MTLIEISPKRASQMRLFSFPFQYLTGEQSESKLQEYEYQEYRNYQKWVENLKWGDEVLLVDKVECLYGTCLVQTISECHIQVNRQLFPRCGFMTEIGVPIVWIEPVKPHLDSYGFNWRELVEVVTESKDLNFAGNIAPVPKTIEELGVNPGMVFLKMSQFGKLPPRHIIGHLLGIGAFALGDKVEVQTGTYRGKGVVVQVCKDSGLVSVLFESLRFIWETEAADDLETDDSGSNPNALSDECEYFGDSLTQDKENPCGDTFPAAQVMYCDNKEEWSDRQKAIYGRLLVEYNKAMPKLVEMRFSLDVVGDLEEILKCRVEER